MTQKKIKPKRDPYRNIKYMGYRLSELPSPYNIFDLVRYAKFQLASMTKTLLKDPIWDSYTAEEILVEFFGHQFVESDELKAEFEKQIGIHNEGVDNFADWADKEMAKSKIDNEKILGGLKDNISFNPNTMGDEDE